MAEPATRLRDLVAATRPRRRGESASAAGTLLWSRAELAGRLVEVSGTGAGASLTLVFALVLDAQRQGETAAWVTSRESSFFPPDVAAGGVDLTALPVVRVPEPQHVPRAAERLLRSGAFGLLVLDLGARAEVATPLQARLVGLAERHDTAVLCLTEKPRGAPSLSSLVSLRVETQRCAVSPEAGSRGSGFAVPARSIKTRQVDEQGSVGAGFQPAPRCMFVAKHAAAGFDDGGGFAAGAGLKPTPTPAHDSPCRDLMALGGTPPDPAPLFRCELVALKDKRRPPGWTYAELCHGPDGLR